MRGEGQTCSKLNEIAQKILRDSDSDLRSRLRHHFHHKMFSEHLSLGWGLFYVLL